MSQHRPTLSDHIYDAAKAASVDTGREAKMFVHNLLHSLADDGHANLASRCGYFLLHQGEPEQDDDKPSAPTPLATQVGGGHYQNMPIQPVEYIHANGFDFCEGCVIKYVSRWREKGGIDDLRKARHFIELLIELEGRA